MSPETKKLDGFRLKVSSLVFQLENIFKWTENKLIEFYPGKKVCYSIDDKGNELLFTDNKLIYSFNRNLFYLNSKDLNKLNIRQLKLALNSTPFLIKELEKCKN